MIKDHDVLRKYHGLAAQSFCSNMPQARSTKRSKDTFSNNKARSTSSRTRSQTSAFLFRAHRGMTVNTPLALIASMG